MRYPTRLTVLSVPPSPEGTAAAESGFAGGLSDWVEATVTTCCWMSAMAAGCGSWCGGIVAVLGGVGKLVVVVVVVLVVVVVVVVGGCRLPPPVMRPSRTPAKGSGFWPSGGCCSVGLSWAW